MQENLREGLHRIVFAYKPQSISRADIDTITTTGAFLPLDTAGEFKVYGPLGTSIRTFPTENTLRSRKGDFHFLVLGLGVMAEDTPQGASLEKDHTANTGPSSRLSLLISRMRGELFISKT